MFFIKLPIVCLFIFLRACPYASLRVATFRGSLRSVLRTPTGPPGGSRGKMLSEPRIKQILGLTGFFSSRPPPLSGLAFRVQCLHKGFLVETQYLASPPNAATRRRFQWNREPNFLEDFNN